MKDLVVDGGWCLWVMNIPNNDMIEIYFEHFDSYFIIENMASIHSSNVVDNNGQKTCSKKEIVNFP